MNTTNPDLVRYAAEKGYRIEADGTVIGSKNKPIRVRIERGYPCITFLYKKQPRRLDIHRLKAYMLYGDELFKPGIEVRHLNGNKLDYSSKNIVLGTHIENSFDIPEKDRKRHSLKASSILRKFNDQDITKIKELNRSGVSYNQLCALYKCAKSTISYIVNEKTYKTSDIMTL